MLVMNMAVVESWHRDSGDVSVRRAAPAGFRFIDVPRDQGRGGGVVISFQDCFIAKPLDINFKASTFEYVCLSITTSCGPVTVVAIYQPGSSAPDGAFFSGFNTILGTLATFNSQLVILGDHNVHLEDPEGGDCISFVVSSRKTQHTLAVLDLSNWRGSAPVFCGAPKGRGELSCVEFETVA